MTRHSVGKDHLTAKRLYPRFVHSPMLILGMLISISPTAVCFEALLSESMQAKQDQISRESKEMEAEWERKMVFVSDSEVENYLREVSLKLLKKDGADLMGDRPAVIKIFRDPTLNAFALPSGHVFFHQGFFTSCRNETQLAFVMAHEMGHVYYRDALSAKTYKKRKAILLNAAEVLVSPVTNTLGVERAAERSMDYLYVSSIAGYSREQEERADLFALRLLKDAGYDPRMTLPLFENLLSEDEKYAENAEIYFLSDHPSNQQRRETVLRWIHEQGAPEERGLVTQDINYLKKTYQLRLENAQINMNQGRYFHALDNINAVISEDGRDSRALCLKGDILLGMASEPLRALREFTPERIKKMLGEQDVEKRQQAWFDEAKASYKRASEIDPQGSLAYRGLGHYFLKTRDWVNAKIYFNKYLEMSPQARDKRGVLRLLRDIEEKAKGVV